VGTILTSIEFQEKLEKREIEKLEKINKKKQQKIDQGRKRQQRDKIAKLKKALEKRNLLLQVSKKLVQKMYVIP